jgi:hypothetical protein
VASSSLFLFFFLFFFNFFLEAFTLFAPAHPPPSQWAKLGTLLRTARGRWV